MKNTKINNFFGKGIKSYFSAGKGPKLPFYQRPAVRALGLTAAVVASVATIPTIGLIIGKPHMVLFPIIVLLALSSKVDDGYKAAGKWINKHKSATTPKAV